MRIAYFTDAYFPGVNGVSVSVDEFSKRLSELGHKVVIYAPAYSLKNEYEYKDGIEIRRYRSVSAPTYKQLHIALPDLPEISTSLKEFDPDIIHVHTPGTIGLVGAVMAKRFGKKLVGTYHTLFSEATIYMKPQKLFKWANFLTDVGGNGFAKGFVEGMESLRELVGWERKPKKERESALARFTWVVVNKFYKYCDVVVVPSKLIKKELEKRDMDKPIMVISNGIEIGKFVAKKRYKLSGTLLHVGRLGFEKNVEVVVEAFAKLVEAGNEFRLLIIGDGPARKVVEEKIVELGLGERVRMLGMISRSRLGKYYREADAFVTASTFETQGVVVLEAMASGLPIVGVRKFALPELVVNGKNGYLTRPFDVAGLADGMAKLMTDQKLNENLGRKSREMVKPHDVNKMVEKMEKLYYEMVG